MEPKTLSASAAEAFEDCPAGYNARVIAKVPDIDGDAALVGSCCHSVLERWVAEGHHMTAAPSGFDVMEELLKEEYYKFFSDTSFMSEVTDILRTWHARQDWEGRIVISTEEKTTFDLPTSRGDLPVTYIWDRCDDLSGGKREVIEVIDYKSFRTPLTSDDLKHKLQPRIYACAANIRFPEAKEIWVSYDHIRYPGPPVGRRFTRAENVETWNYLKALAERIFEDDGTTERINSKCHWCPRMSSCETVQANIEGGGMFAQMKDFDSAVLRYAELKTMEKTIKDQVSELRDYIFTEMEERNLGTKFDTENVRVKIKSRRNRTIDSRRAAAVIGADRFVRVAKLGMTEVNELLKPGVLDDEDREKLEALIVSTPGASWIDTEIKHDE